MNEHTLPHSARPLFEALADEWYDMWGIEKSRRMSCDQEGVWWFSGKNHVSPAFLAWMSVIPQVEYARRERGRNT